MSGAALARIMGIDYGEKRIGVAFSDPLGIVAHPWGVVHAGTSGLSELAELIETEQVRTIVIGLPLTLKGARGMKVREVEDFIGQLRSLIGDTEIIRWDERFTTTLANQTLRTMEKKRSGRGQKSGRVDAMAAALILQSFLDSTKHSRVC